MGRVRVGWRGTLVTLFGICAIGGIGVLAFDAASATGWRGAGFEPFPDPTAVPPPTVSPGPPGCPHEVPTVLFWTGTESTAWTTDVEVLNWRNLFGQPMPYCDGDVVVFDGSATRRTVVVQPDGVVPAGVEFVGYADYLLDGTGAIGITGGASVRMGMEATLRVRNTNTFDGPFLQDGKTTEVDADFNLGKRVVLFTKGELRGTTRGARITIPVRFNAAERIDLSSRPDASLDLTGDVILDRHVSIQAQGNVRISGKIQDGAQGRALTLNRGSLELAFDGNTYSGGTVAERGDLVTGTNSTGTGPVTVARFGVLFSRGTMNGPVTVSGQLRLSGALTIRGTLTAKDSARVIPLTQRLTVDKLMLIDTATYEYDRQAIVVNGEAVITGSPVLDVLRSNDTPRQHVVLTAGKPIAKDSLFDISGKRLKEGDQVYIFPTFYKISYLANGGMSITLTK